MLISAVFASLVVGAALPPADPTIAYIGGGLAVCNADGSNKAVIRSTGTRQNPRNFSMGPSWSPDGGSIAYMEGGLQGKFLMRINVSVVNGVPTGTNAAAIAGPDGGIFQPAWSPLGHEIAFAHIDPWAIEVIPATGGAREVVYAGSANTSHPSWDPSGTKLAFYEGTGATNFNLKVVDRFTGAVTTVFSLGSGWEGTYPEWSRDGSRLVFELRPNSGGTFLVYSLDLATGIATQITSGVSFPCWSPDDSKLICHLVSNGKLATVNVATGAISAFKFGGTWPDWRRF